MTWTVLKTEPEHQSAMNRLEDIHYQIPSPDPIAAIRIRMEELELMYNGAKAAPPGSMV